MITFLLSGIAAGLLAGSFAAQKASRDSNGSEGLSLLTLALQELVVLTVAVATSLALPFVHGPIGTPLFTFLVAGSWSFLASAIVTTKLIEKNK